jgi:hypothetical protein
MHNTPRSILTGHTHYDPIYPQEECLREESRYHYLQHLSTITKIKLDRADYEKQCQKGKAQLMRNFASLKEFYAVRTCAVVVDEFCVCCACSHL